MATEVAEGAASTAAPPSSSGKKKLVIALLLLVMTSAQLAGLYYLLNKSDGPPAPAAVSQDEAAVTVDEFAAAEEAIVADDDSQEVEVGHFKPTNRNATAGMLHVSFTLTAIVPTNRTQAFKEALSKHRARVEQSVGMVIRSSSVDDLNDDELSVIRRLLKEEINKVLKQSFITEMVISNYIPMEI